MLREVDMIMILRGEMGKDTDQDEDMGEVHPPLNAPLTITGNLNTLMLPHPTLPIAPSFVTTAVNRDILPLNVTNQDKLRIP